MLWLYGAPGIGKSRLARDLSAQYEDEAGAVSVFNKLGGTKWWDGYDRHKVVIWDEIEPDYPYNHLLQLFDRYPIRVEFKGSTAEFIAETIIVTSNFSPEDLFGQKPNYSALKRRLTLILNCEGNIYTDINACY